MKINIRGSSPYLEVTIEELNTIINIGLINIEEAKALREELNSAIYDLTKFIGDKDLMEIKK